ncbi:WYL domain-containing protein [Leptolyngbya sp. FACHB-16]|uniref:helix-turn-helix transcriptional regulator n=1 Tax=unclassified Leptolyngbya TaxID=2650499 RepID=UPI001687F5EF|nr:WYL domain-containing protein [Leptolyngbya sp. FACHB-16]MBD2153177.1 WYL domain-containing protein [Leptolyngbya sp. FACHB-16]
MPRKKETLTLSVPPGTKEKLEAIAERLNVRWGNNPSPSGLVVAIAHQEFEVGQPFRLNTAQVKALHQAVRDLIDAGHVEEARSVLTLLLDRGEMEAPLRQNLVRQLNQPLEGWRGEVDKLINQKQSFRLFYQNSQGQALEYTVRYAEVIFYEKRYYLQIWCNETEDSDDLPELKHNRCLRLDRIQGVFSASSEWRGRFDAIKVQLHFKGWLVRAYEPKDDDINDEVVGDIRQVTRNVINPFWLIREVRRYGPECVIVSPIEVRERFKQELLQMIEQYNDIL